MHQDPHSAYVTGSVLRNTLVGQAAAPAISDTLKTDASGNVIGDVSTQLSRHFVIEGMAYTSHGPVKTTVDQTVGFRNTQTFAITTTSYGQIVDQLTSVSGSSRSVTGLVVVGE